jgi:dolichol-phosphate mannosyltransferase
VPEKWDTVSINDELNEFCTRPSQTSCSIVVPTYREAENLPFLIERVESVRDSHGLDFELLIMDDNSQDGSEKVIEKLAKSWVKFIVRTQNRGLSPAVLDGIRLAKHPIIIVMDADLSHPPETIPKLIYELNTGADFAVGSRFADGGTTDDDWGLFRWLNSRVATLMALPLTTIKDPMSGFFALRRETFAAGKDFNPIGYKIGLELMVKCRCRRIVEIPIHFSDRTRGHSKLSFKEQLKYIQHLRRLYISKYGNWSHLAQFLVVGALGVVVNLGILSVCLNLGIRKEISLALGIIISMLTNFALNRRFSFSFARHQSWLRQLIGFVAACSIGAMVNYAVALGINRMFPQLKFQIAVLLGIIAGMGFNFMINRMLVFKQKHIQKRA